MKKISICCFLLYACFTIAFSTACGNNVMGDINNNKKIDLTDAIRLLQRIANPDISAKYQLQELLDQNFFQSANTGGVLCIQTPLFEWIGTTGMSNVSSKTPMKSTDKLRIASMTKTFTATVVLKLVDENVLGLNDYISDYLSDDILDKIENADDITIQHLLSMTSGIYDYSNDDDYFDATQTRPSRQAWLPEELIDIIDGKQSSFFPGEGWEYCNTNYILLEMIVQSVTEKSLAQEMRRLIFDPLNMSQTFMELQETQEGGFGGLIVRGYDLDNSPDIIDITEENDGLGLGDGGLISDVSGLAKFLTAMFDSKSVLSQSSLGLMTNFGGYVSIKDLDDENVKEDAATYGLALGKTITPHGVAWGHDGKSAGFEGEMRYYTDTKVILVLLTNAENDPYGPDYIFDDVMDILVSFKLLEK